MAKAAPRPAPLTADEEAFMRAFVRTLFSVPRALDLDLFREQGMSMTDYFTLMHLSEVPDRRLRMSDLAASAELSLSGMTRIVQRLESAGWVRREKSAADGRSWHAVLTDAGLKRLHEAWPTHLASVRRTLFDHVTNLDLPAITAALESMAASDVETTATEDQMDTQAATSPIKAPKAAARPAPRSATTAQRRRNAAPR